MGYVTEEGVVKAVEGPRVLVEVTQKDQCASCGARGACEMMGGTRLRMVSALNEAGAKEGDRVVVAVESAGLLGAGAVAYMLPVAGVVGGALIGQSLGPSWGWDAQNAAIALALGGLGVMWGLMRVLARRLEESGKVQVRVIRIRERAEEPESCSCC